MSTRRFVDLGRVIFCAASILGIFSTQPVFAGQQDAGIVGSVRDESGAVLPGVRTLRDVGGSSLNQVPTYRVFGQAGEAYSTLEGVQTSSLQASSGQANYWDYTALEEASVRTIGNSAEVPSRGANLNAVVKSGSNEPHGITSYNY